MRLQLLSLLLSLHYLLVDGVLLRGKGGGQGKDRLAYLNAILDGAPEAPTGTLVFGNLRFISKKKQEVFLCLDFNVISLPRSGNFLVVHRWQSRGQFCCRGQQARGGRG